ncbi:hypothetical protein [Yoonia sp.]|uniref:hypothetical protein n=1 Tax=Yoonia sp. TaxID=2212373 RepID=UPI00358DE08F
MMKQSPSGKLLLFLLIFLSLGASALSIYLSVSPRYIANATTSDSLLLATLKNEIYSRFFEIFVVIAGLLSALSAVAGVGGYVLLKSNIDKLIEHSINERVTVAQARTLSIGFNEHAFSWFRRYEPRLQEFLKNKTSLGTPERADCLELVTIARDMAGHGLEPFEELDDAQKALFVGSPRGKKALVNVLNQVVYSETALILLQDQRPSQPLLDELIARADQLLELGLDRSLAEDKYNWWEAVETCAFFKLHIGTKFNHDKLATEGRTLLQYLTNNQRLKIYLQPLPDSVCDTIKSEYRFNGFSELV